MDHGHMLVMLQAGTETGDVTAEIAVDGFEKRTVRLTLE